MNAARWERIQTLFHRAAELPPAERPAFLAAECVDDPTLAAEVLGLLEEDGRAGSILDGDPALFANELLGGGAAEPVPRGSFGPYRLRSVLGEGGMGIVYLAERSDLGSVAAIKVLRDAWLSPARRERFASEQRTLALLNHPSIARLYDADTLADGTPWFAMEYVEGEPITDHCRTRGASIGKRLELFRAVCEAVQHAHRHAVIHRDLKPSNILVTREGAVKLLDFGIAKQLETLDVPADRTRTGLRLMTPAYAAPEQVRGGRVGMHTDVYSLGVLFYELLTGRLPHDLSNRTPAEAETIIVTAQPERPSAVARKTNDRPIRGPGRAAWAELDVLCLTAMHKDPQRRYRTVEALIRDVDHYLAGEPLEARPDSLAYRGRKFVRRNWKTLSVAAAVTAAGIGLVVFSTVRLTLARNEARAEAARTQRIQKFMLSLFEGGDEAAGPADDLRVVTLVDRGAQEARRLDAEPAVQAEMYQTLGEIYQNLGKLEQADELLRTALDQRRTLFGARSAKVAESLVGLGLLRSDQAEYEEAERLVRDGLEMSRACLGASHPAVARATASLGRVLQDRGRYDEAIRVLDEAVRLESGPGASPADLAETLTELANSHFYEGHYDVADTLNRRILEMDRRIYGSSHPHVADDLINLGAVQLQLGQFAEAERYDRQALGIFQGFYGRDHPETASALTAVGRCLVALGRADEAVEMLRESARVQERVYGPVHPRVAYALNELGLVALDHGRLDEAEADFARTVDIYRSVYHDKHSLIGLGEGNLAGVYLEKKNYPRAEALLHDALRRYAETLPPDHMNVGIARLKLGRVFARQGRYAEAEPELLAGYSLLSRQPEPPANWVASARKELVALYEAWKRPEKAAVYRAETTTPGTGPPGSGARP